MFIEEIMGGWIVIPIGNAGNERKRFFNQIEDVQAIVKNHFSE